MWSVDNAIQEIMYCYGIWTEDLDKMHECYRNLKIHEGLPTEEVIEEFSRGEGHRLLVLDDLQSEATNSKLVADLYVRGCHHLGLSLITVTQNLYHKSKYSRLIGLNSHYYIITNSPRLYSQVNTLSSQLGWGKALVESYAEISKSKYSYMCLDLNPASPLPLDLRICTHIFPDESPLIVYKRK